MSMSFLSQPTLYNIDSTKKVPVNIDTKHPTSRLTPKLREIIPTIAAHRKRPNGNHKLKLTVTSQLLAVVAKLTSTLTMHWRYRLTIKLCKIISIITVHRKRPNENHNIKLTVTSELLAVVAKLTSTLTQSTRPLGWPQSYAKLFPL